MQSDWIHVRGLDVRGVQQFESGQDSRGVRIRGSNNLLERLNVHHNEAPGIFITSGANIFPGNRAYENSDDGFDFIRAPGMCAVEKA